MEKQEFINRALTLLSDLYPKSDESLLNLIIDQLESAKGLQRDGQRHDQHSRNSIGKQIKFETILITYGNSITREGEVGLVTLKQFLDAFVGEVITTVHLLPFFPYSSDDGFSVIDYQEINSQIGTWSDIADLSGSYLLMFDAVINHVSRESQWFKRFLEDKSPEKHYFIEGDPTEDYSMVVRPRALPLLTKVKTLNSEKYVWTTFSEDQIDLNYHNPDLLAKMLSILISYAKSGASLIRLDAIAYCWKKQGSRCISLPETHSLVKLIRLCIDFYAPGTRIITETNVPHLENISYFGQGDEANLVYQFVLPPLTMFSFRSKNTTKLMHWLSNLEEPKYGCGYFNFLSSHDGIGLMPIESILDENEQRFLEKCTLESGGKISYKDWGDGTLSAYELNINYQDALSSPSESDTIRIERFIAAETFLISLKGLPGIYIHSLLGSRNNYEELAESGIPRRINRGSLDYDLLVQEFVTGSNRKVIFDELIRRLKIRSEHPALCVNSGQEVIWLDHRLISFMRFSTDVDQKESIFVIVNVSDDVVNVQLKKSSVDLLTNNRRGTLLEIAPRSSLWLLLDE